MHSDLTAERFAFVIAFLVGGIYAYANAWNEALLPLLYVSLTPPFSLASAIIAAVALRRTGVSRKDRSSMVWLSFGAGLVLWFLGELSFAIYAFVFGIEIPFPSVADVFFLVGYIPLMTALIMQAWPFREAFSSRELVFALIGSGVVAAFMLGMLIPPILTADGDFVAQALSVAYPLLDSMLLCAAVPSFVLFMRGSVWKPMLYIFAGIIVGLISDFLLDLTYWTGSYYQGEFAELLYVWAYLLASVGFYLRLRQSTELTF